MQAAHSSTDMTGKVCLVTGATSGIGRVTAKALAAQGAELIIAGRDRRKAEETVAWTKAETGNSNVHYGLADFSDLDQVRALARDVMGRTSRLDVLVNNAGSFFNSRRDTRYGVERTFLVNHLAPFLLTNLLQDPLCHGAPARIVNVSSDAHRYATLDFDDLAHERGFSGIKAYARSKLANVLFTYELARRLEGSGVTANALHPGHIATGMWGDSFRLLGPVIKWAMGFFALTPEQGADNSIYLASSPDVDGITGAYFAKREPVESSPLSYDEEVARTLWDVCIEIVGLNDMASQAGINNDEKPIPASLGAQHGSIR
jgi:NAD(P)-dependent dehydrogenase (short-subunit alcohol dehydrogenase family)